VPARNGPASDDVAALGRHKTWGAARAALAAAVTLLPLAPVGDVPETEDAPLASEPDEAPERDAPLALVIAAVPVLMTAPMPVFEALVLCGTELVAPTPEAIAPGPVTVPAVAAPPPLPPRLDGADVVPDCAAAAGVGFALVSVPDGVVAAPSGGAGRGADGPSAGSCTAPEPTWPAPLEPGVGPPAGSLVVACCADAGIAASSAMASETAFARQQRRRSPIPRRDWPSRAASARVGVR